MNYMRIPILKTTIDGSNVTVTIEQIIKWARCGRGAYIELLRSLALWQLKHPEEAKVIHRTDEELLALLPNGVNDDGTIRMDGSHWLTPVELETAIENPVVYDHIHKLAQEGDCPSERILDEYEKVKREYVEQLVDNICYRSWSFTSIDINDVNYIIRDKHYIDGECITFSCDSYRGFLNRLDNLKKRGKMQLAGLLVYIESSSSDPVNEQKKRMGQLIDYLEIPKISNDLDVKTGIGQNTDIESGYLRMTIIAGYKK